MKSRAYTDQKHQNKIGYRSIPPKRAAAPAKRKNVNLYHCMSVYYAHAIYTSVCMYMYYTKHFQIKGLHSNSLVRLIKILISV